MRTLDMLAASALLVLACLPAGLVAQSGPSLMQADELRMRLADGDAPTVLWVGGDETWETGRIPGAERIGLGDVAISEGDYGAPGSIVLDLPLDLDRVRSEFEARGVSSDRDVVVVFDSPRRLTHATRVVWTLSVLGMGDRTYLLDGGQPAWVAAGGDLSDARPGPTDRPRSGISTPVDEARVVDLGWLAREYRGDDLAIVDARAPASYTGEREEFPGRAGHIPGAGNLPVEALLDDEGRMLPIERLTELLGAAGAREGSRVVTYCHIGQRASAAWFAATLAGFDAAIYDGSMNEWARTELPLTSGENR